MSGATGKGDFDGLPLKFVSSMKVLFDILDDGETGYILLSDLEKWWIATDGTQSDDQPPIPAEALESLRRITPPNGRLSFERFISGLKLSLLKARLQNREGNSVPVFEKKVNLISENAQNVQNGYHHGFYSEQDLHVKTETGKTSDASNLFFSRRQPRTSSMSRLNEMLATTDAHAVKISNTRSSNSSNSDQGKIMYEGSKSKIEQKGNIPSWSGKRIQSEVSLKLEKSNASNGRHEMDDGKDLQQGDERQVTRRHTLTSGIDYNFIPIMKLMQQEKEVLLKGLQAVDVARSWYLQRLKVLQEKQRNFEKASLPSDYSLQANKEHFEFEKLRINSVNQELRALVSSSEKHLPSHMNLAISEMPETRKHYINELDALKLRNQILTQELGQKAKAIAKLEREKVILVKEMFQAKTNNHRFSSEEMTLI